MRAGGQDFGSVLESGTEKSEYGESHFGNHDVGVGIAFDARRRADGLGFQEPSQFPHGEHSSLLDEA